MNNVEMKKKHGMQWCLFIYGHYKFKRIASNICQLVYLILAFISKLITDFQSDSDSFNPTLWEEQRQQRMTVAFEFEEKKEEEENAGKVKVSGIIFLNYSCSSGNVQ